MRENSMQTMKLFKLSAILLATVLFSIACSHKNTGRIVLQGEISGDPGEVIILSYISGESKGYHYPEVKDGRFEFTLDNIEEFTDLIVSVGGVEFGARINVRDTMKMKFKVNDNSNVDVTYDGATEKESRIWTDFYETYDHWSNYNLYANRDNSITYEESLADFEKNDSIFRARYAADFDDYYLRRTNMAHDLLKSIFIEQISYRDNVDPFTNAEYLEMAERVDPNDSDQSIFPTVYRWMRCKELEISGTQLEKDVQFLKKYGEKVTNCSVKSMLAESIASSMMMDIQTDNVDIYEPLFTELKQFVPNDTSIVADFRMQIEAIKNSVPGAKVPDTYLKKTDGDEILLSSLFGRVLYIDVWATWCGPCVKESPYFRELAQKYKDDPRICFISISIDETDAPWLKFLEREEPFWPQYRLDGINESDFCGKIGINGIPRFLLIDAEGKFIDSDCARPSSEEIEKILTEALQ